MNSSSLVSRDLRLSQAAQALGYNFEGEIRIGGNYTSLIRDGDTVYLSGQIPRVGTEVLVCGRAGTDISLAQAQLAAKICIMRALTLLQRELGSLEQLRAILRITVFVQCASDFTQHSEVADAASALLYEILAPNGAHTRTSTGVFQLPKNATVELDLIASAQPI